MKKIQSESTLSKKIIIKKKLIWISMEYIFLLHFMFLFSKKSRIQIIRKKRREMSSSSSSSSLVEKNVHIKLKTFSFSDAYQIVHLQLVNIHRHSRMEKSSCKRTTDTHSKTKELFTLFFICSIGARAFPSGTASKLREFHNCTIEFLSHRRRRCCVWELQGKPMRKLQSCIAREEKK